MDELPKSWIEDALKNALIRQYSINIKDLKIDQHIIQVYLSQENVTNPMNVFVELVTLTSYIYGFFKDDDVSYEKITVSSSLQNSEILNFELTWDGARFGAEGSAWKWVTSLKIVKLANEEDFYQSHLSLFKFENFMREYLAKQLQIHLGHAWEDKAISSSLKRKAKDNKSKNRPFDQRPALGGLLRYLDFPDLRAITNANWASIDIRNIDIDVFNQLYSEIEPMRIALAHNQRLSHDEVVKFISNTEKLIKGLEKNNFP